MLLLVACVEPSPTVGIDQLPPPAWRGTMGQAHGQALQDALDAARVLVGAPGATMAVDLGPAGWWAGGSGVFDTATGEAMPPDAPMRVGSVTKTFTAAVVLQLDEEDALDIDDALTAWLPAYPQWAGVTLRMLLSHTSGIYDYAAEAEALVMDQHWEPTEIVALVEDEPLLFEPGTGWSYSNTNYVLLGMIVEEATGSDWGEEVRARLLDPQGLGLTWVEGEEALPVPLARGYLGETDVTDQLDASLPWAAGAVVSTAPDLARWARVLWGGDVLEARTLRHALDPVVLPDGTVVGYGLGVELWADEDGDWAGHDGQTLAYQAEVMLLLDRDVAVTALTDNIASDASIVSDAGWEVVRGW